ncbi:hypothetical protein [Barrientosiimonas humi]|uniref:hypothetical protein n=1 Tax=Barrientosiimonas humi TaxID=999931 RepID=UPI00370DD4CA
MSRQRFRAVPRSALAVLAGGVAAVVLLRTWSLMTWAYSDWIATSATTRESLVLALPWAAAVAAWTAGRYLSPRNIMCPPSATRSGRPVAVAQLGLLSLAAVVGWLMGCAPLLVWTARHARAGGPDLLVIAGAALVLLAALAFGYLLGCLLPRVASVTVAASVTLLGILAVDVWGPAVAPVRLATPAAGLIESGPVTVFRLLFFASVVALFAAAASHAVSERSVVRRATTYAGVALILVPLLIGGIARQSAPAAVQRESSPAARCTTVQGTPVCVHAAKAAILAPLAEVVDRVLTAADAPAGALGAGVADDALGVPRDPATTVLSLQTDQSDWDGWAAGDLAAQLAGLPACDRRGDVYGEAVGPAQDARATSVGFARWIAEAAGFAPPQLDGSPDSGMSAKLQRLQASSVLALLRRDGERLRECRLPSSAIR